MGNGYGKSKRGNGHSTWTWTKHYPKRLPRLSLSVSRLELDLVRAQGQVVYGQLHLIFDIIGNPHATPWPETILATFERFFLCLFLFPALSLCFFTVFFCVFFFSFSFPLWRFMNMYELCWWSALQSARGYWIYLIWNLLLLPLFRFALPLYILEVATSLCLFKLSSCRLKFNHWRVLQIGWRCLISLCCESWGKYNI